MNVGPTADGRIIPAFQERLLQIGEWLSVNGAKLFMALSPGEFRMTPLTKMSGASKCVKRENSVN